jgi:DNA mismatch endonuclease (patch repair protein)
MPNIFTKAKRSEVMARIRSRGNEATELALAKLFRRHKITGWRRHIEIREKLKGKLRFKVRPDFVFSKLRLAVFVDGCFWHGCPKHKTKPKNNRRFWQRKFAANQRRDRLVNRRLRGANWRVVRLWEHEVTRSNEDRAMQKIHRAAAHGRNGI